MGAIPSHVIVLDSNRAVINCNRDLAIVLGVAQPQCARTRTRARMLTHRRAYASRINARTQRARAGLESGWRRSRSRACWKPRGHGGASQARTHTHPHTHTHTHAHTPGVRSVECTVARRLARRLCRGLARRLCRGLARGLAGARAQGHLLLRLRAGAPHTRAHARTHTCTRGRTQVRGDGQLMHADVTIRDFREGVSGAASRRATARRGDGRKGDPPATS